MTVKTTVKVAWGLVALDLILLMYWLAMLIYASVNLHEVLTGLILFVTHFAGMTALLAYLENAEKDYKLSEDDENVVPIYDHRQFPLVWGLAVCVSFVADLFSVVEWGLYYKYDVANIVSQTSFGLIMFLYVLGFAVTFFSLAWILYFYFTYMKAAGDDNDGSCSYAKPSSHVGTLYGQGRKKATPSKRY